jgi:hypothetical protein
MLSKQAQWHIYSGVIKKAFAAHGYDLSDMDVQAVTQLVDQLLHHNASLMNEKRAAFTKEASAQPEISSLAISWIYDAALNNAL